MDDHTREALTVTVERRIDADAIVAVLDRLVAERQTAPRFLHCDNDPELTASNPVAPTTRALTGGNAAEPCASLRLKGHERT